GEHDDPPRLVRESLEELGAAPAPAAARKERREERLLREGGLVSGNVDDLVHALVREAQLVGDLAERSASAVQAADRVVLVAPGSLDVVLEVDEPVAFRLSLLNQLRVEHRYRLVY